MSASDLCFDRPMAPFFSDAQIANTLATVPLFSECSMPQVRQIAQAGMIVSREAGADVVAEGTHGVAFFVLLAGSVSVSRGGDQIDTMKAGDFFGETALLETERRTAEVVTIGRTRLASLIAWHFRDLTERHPEIAARINQAIDVRMGRGSTA